LLASTNLEGAVKFRRAPCAYLIADKLFTFRRPGVSNVTASFGVSTVWNEPGVDLLTLVKARRRELYAAKHAGRNQVIPSVASVGGLALADLQLIRADCAVP